MIYQIAIFSVSLLTFTVTACMANTAWMGCFTIPPQGLSGTAVSSSQTFSPSGCAAQCSKLPDYGFSPVTYALYSASKEIGNGVQSHCLCTNDVPFNDDYNGPSTPSDCQNDQSYAATLVDTSVQFEGCYSTLYTNTIVSETLENSYTDCIKTCSSYKYIAIDHYNNNNNENNQINCKCSPFIINDPNSSVICDNEKNNYLIYNNLNPQPSGSFNDK
ncbi:uncharacterized protein L201_005202 [Kwoniella dendrophila CBS 6074]|uniref:WSC domain-containing protein n=1 Tax=Kwoniella dendrophila CBS 6074 TaxID=1295534 RepID=A0AAX4JYK0_9TREE